MSPVGPVHVRAPGKALVSWDYEIEKRTKRLRQFDICETPFMNKYRHTIRFIIIFGSGHFSGREARGKSSSVTTHRIPRNVTAMYYEFAITQCPISQLSGQRTIFQSCSSV